MKIGPLVSKRVVTVGPKHSLREAARRMNEHGVGSAVVVTEEGHPAIITERDVLRAIAQGGDPGAVLVQDYMTVNAITASESWDVLEAARRMLNGGFRHLIVLGDDGQTIGMLSIRDLVQSLLDELAE